ncbi:ATP-binding protein [Sedimentibacter sp. MB31-C6]|uniref:ATP-binding protein n=1 Tax=Sedimentibacter sp. MB31-C6 TaxID=3109366 RepID=UPI002DDCF4B7|nr:ATP-binding protein [Sedimentibacter sp. MB36-C1]WSI04493.1 ATP-binding protein [Sedimentibacter sp. MB36-C1]
MVQLVCGHNGTGKTKRMIEMANNYIDGIQGKMVFLEASNRHIFDLDYKIRYINTKEFGLTNDEQFQGFVCGLIATDYDVELVYIDGLYKIAQANMDKLETVIQRLDFLSKKFDVDFVMSVNHDKEAVPEVLKDRVIS